MRVLLMANFRATPSGGYYLLQYSRIHCAVPVPMNRLRFAPEHRILTIHVRFFQVALAAVGASQLEKIG